ncbi:predicted protein [Botrytis cinerea T4]|uniref:Uncharacterized protein n=1 Tax=Botryotinia fuckeliana (strain T4) TaxID=999810 RepID=G2YJ02_BOTF4|nr:predicted protein [Botrytis cinerea T4]
MYQTRHHRYLCCPKVCDSAAKRTGLYSCALPSCVIAVVLRILSARRTGEGSD